MQITPHLPALEALRGATARLNPMALDMRDFHQELPSCGSVGCVIGWATESLSLNPHRLAAPGYSAEVLGLPVFSPQWDQLFGARWAGPRINPVPQVEQHRQALARLDDVIAGLQADPDWFESEAGLDWAIEKEMDAKALYRPVQLMSPKKRL